MCALQRSRSQETTLTVGGIPISDRKLFTTRLVLAIVLLDQVTKLLARIYLRPKGSLQVVADYLRFTYVENPGMAFGIQIENKLIFNAISFLAILVIFYYLFKLKDNALLRVSFSFILGGAFGNLIGRIFEGRVVDFIDVGFFNVQFQGAKFLFFQLPPFALNRWPVFNLADVAILLGMITILMNTFLPLQTETTAAYATQRESQI